MDSLFNCPWRSFLDVSQPAAKWEHNGTYVTIRSPYQVKLEDCLVRPGFAAPAPPLAAAARSVAAKGLSHVGDGSSAAVAAARLMSWLAWHF